MTEIFTRLTFNANGWKVPSGHAWRKKSQGKSNIPFENQYGFGHEEWLFNVRYNISGWQHGYIRGLKSYVGTGEKLDKVFLYTVRKVNNQKLVYLVGYLENVVPL